MTKRLMLAVAVLLVGILAVGFLTIWKPASSDQAHGRLAGVGQRLTEAKTARIAFTSQIEPQVSGPKVTWQGTTEIKFGDEPEWSTTYDQIQPSGRPAVQAKAVRVAGETYYSSPSMVAQDGRPWFSAKTPTYWGAPLVNPEHGIADFTVWQAFLDGVRRVRETSEETDELPDVEGAEHEYQFECYPDTGPNCPPPYGTALDQTFNEAYPPRVSVWLDDDGLLRQLRVRASVGSFPDRDGGSGQVGKLYGEWIITTTFTLDRFGEPVSVTAPPSDQITRSMGVRTT
ncbi:hypothetical protein [Plantactinospora sp. GCM10030261]|uniref:hypothetical protein n=1 Tax=Plantactinospora sp. GCM10030261 TaxID=3273420 RepID=UPI003607DB10